MAGMFIVSGPSGAGKTTLVKEVIRRDPSLHLSVSCTTRPRHEGEVDGVDYHFASREEFAKQLERGEFVEWADVHGQLYGTLKAEVFPRLAEGHDVVLEIDCQGMHQIKKRFPSAHAVFVMPPSLRELDRRIRERGRGETDREVMRRIRNAERELIQARYFDHLVLNPDGELEKAVRDTLGLIKRARQCLPASVS